MSPLWKSLLALAVVLPVGGYVAGSLAASSADDPAPREVIVIQDAPSRSPSPGTTLSPRPSPAPSPDDGRPSGAGSEDGRPGDVPVVSPEPDDIDEDERDEDERDEDEGDDDHGDDD